MWFSTEEEAKKDCERKEIEWGEEFIVVKDLEKEDVYWTQRKNYKKNIFDML